MKITGIKCTTKEEFKEIIADFQTRREVKQKLVNNILSKKKKK